jgi:hypothetical protein
MLIAALFLFCHGPSGDRKALAIWESDDHTEKIPAGTRLSQTIIYRICALGLSAKDKRA